jgi:bifunctional DNA-binding transcriptional regulator/antitoxin component of YhaV-PrlF toxin-antitoxin module
MLAKMTIKNQITLPKRIVTLVGAKEYFEVETRNGQIILTPVSIHRGDAIRAKLAALNLEEEAIQEAVSWSRDKERS